MTSRPKTVTLWQRRLSAFLLLVTAVMPLSPNLKAQEPVWGPPAMQRGIAAVTCAAPSEDRFGTPAGVPIPELESFPLGFLDVWTPDPLCYTPPGQSAKNTPRDEFHHLDWNVFKLGNLFGLAIDNQGHTYVAAHGLYDTDLPTYRQYGNLGDPAGGKESLKSAGTIYKIDAQSGAPSVFNHQPLPQNAMNLGGSLTTTQDFISGPGIGNIAYDRKWDQYYVTNLEDGKIYTLNGSGVIIDNNGSAPGDAFDPLIPDSGLPGMPPLKDRIWGIAVHDNFIYYSVWNSGIDDGINNNNAEACTIRRVPINSSNGTIIGVFDNQFAEVPTNHPSQLFNDRFLPSGAPIESLPVSDIAFNFEGTKMILAERTMILQDETSEHDHITNPFIKPFIHDSRVHVFDVSGSTAVLESTLIVGGITGTNTNGSDGFGGGYGGVSFGPEMGWEEKLVWITGGDLAVNQGPHGLQGLRPDDFPVGGTPTPASSFFRVPYDRRDTTSNGDLKGIGGDVELFQVDCDDADLISLEISDTILNPEFDKDILNYTAETILSPGQNQVTVSPIAARLNAQVFVNGILVPACESIIVSVVSGINLEIEVVSPDQSMSRTYIVTPTRLFRRELEFCAQGANILDSTGTSPIINVSGVDTLEFDQVRVSINGLTHEQVGELSPGVTAPGGVEAMLFAECGNNPQPSKIDLSFEDQASATLPETSLLESGLFRPTECGMYVKQSSTTLVPDLDSLATIGNGTWRLFVNDRFTGNNGAYDSWSVTFTSISTGDPEIEIEAPDGAQISSGSSFNFGKWVKDSSQRQKFLVRNVGIDNLEITDIQINGSTDFQVDFENSASTVGFGQPGEIWVNFSPSSLGIRLAMVTISTNDPDESSFTIPIIGEGVSAIDLAQDSYLKAAVNQVGSFGTSVAISGGIVAVGAPRALNFTGQVNIFEIDQTTGVTSPVQTIGATGIEASDEFGKSIALDGDLLVVGAPGDDSSAAGSFDNGLSNSGKVFVFKRGPFGLWVLRDTLKASNPGAHDRFGTVVSISADTVVVGAPFERSSSVGVNNSHDDALPSAGAAYVFTTDCIQSDWIQEAFLKASNTDASDYFGRSIAIDGDVILVGATGEDSGATGVNQNQSDNSTSSAGAAYLFQRIAGTWAQTDYLKASNTDPADFFGTSVAVCGDLIAIGAEREGSNSPGVGGNQGNNNAGRNSGAVYVFERQNGSWNQQEYIKASNPSRYHDRFGFSLALTTDTLLVGARMESSSADTINGPDEQITPLARGSGAGYLFIRIGSTWMQESYIKATNRDPHDRFGHSVAMDGNTIVIGSPNEDSNATDVDGDLMNNSTFGAGAAYLFNYFAP